MKDEIIRQTNEVGYTGNISRRGYTENHEFIEKHLIITMDLKGNKVLIEELEKIGWEKVKTYKPLGLDNNEGYGMLVELRYKLD